MIIITIIATIPAMFNFKEDSRALEPIQLKQIEID